MDSTSQNPQGSTPPPPPYQPGQQQYPPPGSFSPQPQAQKKSFNWLACCGITCLVLVIILGAVGYCGYRTVLPFMNVGMQMNSLPQTIADADIATIKANATFVTPELLVSETSQYQDQWLRLEGVLEAEGEAFGGPPGASGTENATTYVMAGNILVMDLSETPSVAGAGETIIAYGKCFGWDLREMESIPFFGKYIAEELKKAPELGGNMQMVFFFAKEVERVGVAGDDAAVETADSKAEPEDDSGSGWLR